MALIPTDPKRQKLLIVAVAITAALYAFWEFLHSPRKEEIAEMETRLEQLQDQNTRAQILATRGGKQLQERLVLYERHIAQLERLIPAGEEVPDLLNDMALEARQSDVELALMRPEPAETGTFYTKQSYSMGVLGSYHDVAGFLTAVASLPRIVTPVDLEVVTAEEAQQRLAPEGTTLVVARFRIQTYVLPPPGGPGAPGGGGPAQQGAPPANPPASEG